MAQLSNICYVESYDDIVLMGDFICDRGRGRFFNEFSDVAVDHFLCTADINGLPARSYTYISPNASAATSWFDHILSSRHSLVSNISILYGHSAYDHIALCC